MQKTGDLVQLTHIGEIIHGTMDDLFEGLDELDGLNRDAFQEFKAKVPADPEELAKDKERNHAFADHLAAKLRSNRNQPLRSR